MHTSVSLYLHKQFLCLLLQIDRREEFDQIVIETTGLANPHSIIRTFSMVQEVWDTMQLDAVVTLVDAKHIERQLDEKKPEGVDNEALKQLAYADRVVLNKVDLVSGPIWCFPSVLGSLFARQSACLCAHAPQ